MDMKTPEEILSNCTVGGYAEHGEYLYDFGEINEEMKEYAKQWVKKALEESGEVDLTLFIELEKEIDKQ